jgi:hypothetical protein
MRCNVGMLSLVLVVVAGLGCERREPPPPSFSREAPAEPVPVRIVKQDVITTTEGFRVAELHLVFLATPTEASARATLQHAIDSATAADTALKSVRVTGFLVGTPDTAGVADVLPAISGVWAPNDTAALRAGRRVQFRTTFTILRPLAADGGTVSRP